MPAIRCNAPRPAEPWTGIRDATKEGKECTSRHLVFNYIVGSEDCLFLNVYTPQLPVVGKHGLKPVMVWIHGGGFSSGSSSTEAFGPDFLIPHDVVVVTLNYRLGALGFLSLSDVSLRVPGNAGLKDIVEALRWVQKNISKFNGDPGNVTIFGESAGGAAVHYLILSPMAKGLFHRAIAQSGVALNPWAQGRQSAAFELAKVLNYDGKDEKEILRILQATTVNKLVKAQDSVKDFFSVCKIRPFCPVVESPSEEPAFLLQSPIDIITSGNYNKVPFMMGYNTREGILSAVITERTYGKVELVTDFEVSIPFFLNYAKGSSVSRKAAAAIKQFYYGNEQPSMENIDRYYLLQTDNFFYRGIHSTIKNHLKTSHTPIYLYRFSAETLLNVFKILRNIKDPGVCHADELGYLFKNLLTPELQPHSLEEITVRRMTKLWATFARYGDPNPKEKDPLITITWNPAEEGNHHYIDIGENLTVGINPEAQRMEFWDKIYQMSPTMSKL